MPGLCLTDMPFALCCHLLWQWSSYGTCHVWRTLPCSSLERRRSSAGGGLTQTPGKARGGRGDRLCETVAAPLPTPCLEGPPMPSCNLRLLHIPSHSLPCLRLPPPEQASCSKQPSLVAGHLRGFLLHVLNRLGLLPREPYFGAACLPARGGWAEEEEDMKRLPLSPLLLTLSPTLRTTLLLEWWAGGGRWWHASACSPERKGRHCLLAGECLPGPVTCLPPPSSGTVAWRGVCLISLCPTTLPPGGQAALPTGYACLGGGATGGGPPRGSVAFAASLCYTLWLPDRGGLFFRAFMPPMQDSVGGRGRPSLPSLTPWHLTHVSPTGIYLLSPTPPSSQTCLLLRADGQGYTCHPSQAVTLGRRRWRRTTGER